MSNAILKSFGLECESQKNTWQFDFTSALCTFDKFFCWNHSANFGTTTISHVKGKNHDIVPENCHTLDIEAVVRLNLNALANITYSRMCDRCGYQKRLTCLIRFVTFTLFTTILQENITPQNHSFDSHREI